MRARTAAAATALLLALAGCAILPLGAPVPSVQNIGKARAAGIAPVALGTFRLAPGVDPAIDQRIVIRSNTVHAPTGSSFAQYLRETLATDLQAAGLLAPAASTVISGELLDSRIDVPTGTAPAWGTVAARFTVTRAGVRSTSASSPPAPNGRRPSWAWRPSRWP
ncbi:hypothetical protein HK414_03755 [Ramlibacter terrae]|uniref:DUF4410 domain-containing protein n=1 Tax=Ramlibacter terrae TaxID=2732511 RepID=A0ABX6P0F7_9BURK|nr:hypothetical protein HK414_03755 [Ramlibacter terrae]